MEAAARLTATAALSAPWFSTSATPAEDAAGVAPASSSAHLPSAVRAVSRSPASEGKQATYETSPSSVLSSPLPSAARSDSKRRFSKVDKRDSIPSPFSVRPLQVPCSSSSSILASSDRPSVATLSRHLSLDERLGLEYGLPRSSLTVGPNRTSSQRTPTSEQAEVIIDRHTVEDLEIEDLDDALLPRTDEMREIDNISIPSPLTGTGAPPAVLPEELALHENDATTDEFGIDMASAIETWKANQAAGGGVADESLDVSRASTVCMGLQGLGLEREHSELNETRILFRSSTAEGQRGKAAWGRGRTHSYSSALASVGEATGGSGTQLVEKEVKPDAPTPSVPAPKEHREDDETDCLLSTFGSRAAAATTASVGQQPILGGGEFEGGDVEDNELEHHLNILHMTFLHTLLEDDGLSAVHHKLVCRHLQGTRQLQSQLQGDDISMVAPVSALPMSGRRAMRASSFPLVPVRNAANTLRTGRSLGARGRAWTDLLTAEERIDVLRKGLRTMFGHPRKPYRSHLLPTALCPRRIAPN